MRIFYFVAVVTLAFIACQPKSEGLPILGNHMVDPTSGDTTYHHIPTFAFTNQDSQLVDNASFTGKAYVADLFFISCPTICPKVAKQMKRIYDRYETDDRLALLSHTIDPKRDTVARLKKYAEGLGVEAPKWHFVTGEKDKIYDIAQDYMSIAREDEDAPGGFDHSGWLLLIDKDFHIRSFCNGTEAEAVDQFMKDIDLLLEEM
ncbi:MAG: SCO family protein [Saprospiraceae bacterium]|nr:SCO family protein [Saprospiraceae bacterium]